MKSTVYQPEKSDVSNVGDFEKYIEKTMYLNYYQSIRLRC